MKHVERNGVLWIIAEENTDNAIRCNIYSIDINSLIWRKHEWNTENISFDDLSLDVTPNDTIILLKKTSDKSQCHIKSFHLIMSR